MNIVRSGNGASRKLPPTNNDNYKSDSFYNNKLQKKELK